MIFKPADPGLFIEFGNKMNSIRLILIENAYSSK
jgi:hypothetical protein